MNVSVELQYTSCSILTIIWARLSTIMYSAHEPTANRTVEQISETEYTALDSIIMAIAGHLACLSATSLLSCSSMLQILYAMSTEDNLISNCASSMLRYMYMYSLANRRLVTSVRQKNAKIQRFSSGMKIMVVGPTVPALAIETIPKAFSVN